MTGYNLPDGCTDEDIEKYWGESDEEDEDDWDEPDPEYDPDTGRYYYE